MCAISSFSELQNITRHRSKEEIKSLLKNHRIKQAQMSSKCPETTKRSRNMEAGLLFLLPYLRMALKGAFLTPQLVALSSIKKRLSQGYQYIPSTLLDILLTQINNGTKSRTSHSSSTETPFLSFSKPLHAISSASKYSKP